MCIAWKGRPRNDIILCRAGR